MNPLDDLTIIETGDGIGIRYAGRLLGQLGAHVIRPDGPGPTAIGYGAAAGAAYAAWLDEGKTHAPAPAAADLILTEGHGELPEELREAGETALVAALDWFEAAGPYAHWRGSDAVIAALSGWVHPFGPAEGPPALPQGPGPQVIAAVTLCIAVLGGLIGRRDGAGPARISTSIFEATLCLTETVSMVFQDEGVAPGRLGVNRYYPSYPAVCWKARDGWVGVTTVTPAQWRTLCELAGLPDMGADPAYATSEQRTRAADEIDRRFAPRMLARSVAEWVEEGQAARVPIVAVPRPGELPDSPHWQARGSFRPVPGFAGTRAPRNPFRIVPGAPLARPAGATRATPGKPLAGLRVLDFSKGWSGPLGTRHLGSLGADVLKVESTSNPDWWRGWNGIAAGDPPPEELRREFVGMNINKRGLHLDLADPADNAQALRLAAQADMMIENFATGVMDKLGLGHDRLQQASPGLVSVSMALFGAEGPHALHRGYGSTNDQASSLAFVNGAEDWPPSQCHVALGDAIAGLYSAFAALAGIWGRPRHGGMRFDLAQVETLFQIAAPAIIAEQVEGRPVRRDPAGRPLCGPTVVLPAAGEDDWLVIAIETDADWRALWRWLGHEDAPARPAPGPREAEALPPELAARVAALPAETLAAELQTAGVPAAMVRQPQLLNHDPQLLAGGFWQWGERRYTGSHLLANLSYRLDGARVAIERVTPVLGEHTEEIFAELLDPGRRDAAGSA